MSSQLFQILFQHFWVFIVLILVAIAVIWRVGATARIKADPSLTKPLNWLYGGFAFWTTLPFFLMGMGIVIGDVGSVFQYLTVDTGNPFITAFHALLFMEDALFIYWVFFRGGDHLLALHTEISSARSKIRVAMRVLAIALPLLHSGALYYATSSPHFGQFFGAKGA